LLTEELQNLYSQQIQVYVKLLIQKEQKMSQKFQLCSVIILVAVGNSFQHSIAKRSDSEGGRAQFQIDQRYPDGRQGEIPTIILKKDQTIEFSCATTDEITSCDWMGPFHEPRYACKIINDDSNRVNSKDCDGRGWSRTANYQTRIERKNGHNVCIIKGKIGYDLEKPENGKWKCRLETILKNGEYVDAQEEFNVEFLKPASVVLKIAPGHHADNELETQIFENEEMEVTCEAKNGLPAPHILWKLNSKEIDFQSTQYKDRFIMISNEGPTEDYVGSWSQTQKIKYIANLDDNGEILQCHVRQEDDKGTIDIYSNEDAKLFLSVKQILEPPRALSMGIVGAIVGVIIAIILAFFVPCLCLAY